MAFDIGAALLDLRLSRKLTLDQVAERAKISAATVSRIERGEIRAAWDSISAIAEACGVQAEAMFYDPNVAVTLGLRGGRYEAVSANILGVEAYTNTPMGGDGGHGGVTLLSFEDIGSTGWSIEVSGPAESPNRVTLRMRGDTECETLIECLEFAVKTLREARDV